MTSIEEDLNGRQPQWKKTSMEDDRVEQELRENLDLGFLGAKLSRSKHKLEEKSVSNLARV